MSQTSNNELSKSIMAILAILGLIALIQVFVLSMMSGGVGSNQISDVEDPALVAQRLKPEVTLADIRGGDDNKAVAAPVMAEKSAKELYDASCSACHNNGVAGAPKPGDKAAWQSRYANGMGSLLAAVVNGKGAMPAKGGSTYSDAELTKAIEYLLIESDVMDAQVATSATKNPAEATSATMNPAKAISGIANSAASMAAMLMPSAASNDIDLAAGENSYTSSCAACHNNGIAGAPKFGVPSDWVVLRAQGMQSLISSVINGKGAMPPKGGAGHLTNADIKNIVGYMLNKSQ